MALGIGRPAPEFTLPDAQQEPVDLRSFRGSPVALVFVPFAFSGKCTSELCEVRDNLDVLTRAGVGVVGISCDPTHSLRAWGESERYTFPLLSDFWPHGAVAEEYGVFDAGAGRAVRGTFLVDSSGVLRWSVVNPANQARDFTDLARAVAAL